MTAHSVAGALTPAGGDEYPAHFGLPLVKGLVPAGGAYQGGKGRAVQKEREMDEWSLIKDAPRDGTNIDLTWIEDGKPQIIAPMWWDGTATNGLFPGKRGFWVTAGRDVSWSEHGGHGPTHFRYRR